MSAPIQTQPADILSMKDLLAKEEFHLPKVGQIVSGEIVSVSKSSVMVDLGSMGIGVVYPGEFYDNPERMKALQPGEKVSAMLLELENDQGYRELSLRAAQMTTAWQDIKEKKEKGEIIKTGILDSHFRPVETVDLVIQVQFIVMLSFP